eukprot:Protomagalhaensia_wolfi_Nauph_80__3668@NODE_36_length_4469_cov_116_886230_g28_i0_p5_GENE_NODE_36_length_4469_cov_116_886230_g28_i0NODE_36_length_4469_cov_116_886230_g28_i0_p5_ORF_typecomplete_len126_score11_79KASH_CCD/PF14662_6/0_0036NRBF2/PF08961_10/0_0064Mod_r/PF07200_13/0_086Mod_r/PF07200_13/4_6e03KLRAQ/PF10205_9/0_085TIMELESS_C/PF05029_13/0_09YabA/PF06156_13/0_19_NODE_36_length_4469_cov_116_886230_g28_i027673144
MSEADQDTNLRELYEECRSAKQVMKTLQDNNGLLMRENDRLAKKNISLKCEIERGAVEGVHQCRKRPRVSMSDELREDPEWQDLIASTAHSNETFHRCNVERSSSPQPKDQITVGRKRAPLRRMF